MKVCKDCHIEKELYDFPKNKQMKDGHINQCKSCRSVYLKLCFHYTNLQLLPLKENLSKNGKLPENFNFDEWFKVRLSEIIQLRK